MILSKANLTAINNAKERVLQFGAGNFLRAFYDYMIDVINEKEDFGKALVVVSKGTKRIEAMAKQDFLYTCLIRGVKDSKVYEEFRLVSSISRAINPYEDWLSYKEAAKNADMRFVFSNTTEAGICYEKEESLTDRCPSSFPAKLASFLYERFCFFNGEADKGMLILPAELIENNGSRLKDLVIRQAKAHKLSEGFIEWVNQHCVFFNTLVDRIVPGFPKDEDAKIFERLGYEDNFLVCAEAYNLLVIEGNTCYKEELCLHKSTSNVIWTDDLNYYRERKVKVLNGLHTATVLLAYLYGVSTVYECVNNVLLRKYMEKVAYEEIAKTSDGDDIINYAKDIFKRFENPQIKHYCLTISLNSLSKFKVRVLPTMLEYIKRFGKAPKALCLAFASLIRFYKVYKTDGGYFGKTANGEYEIKDEESSIKKISLAWQEFPNNMKALTTKILSEKDLWGKALCDEKSLVCEISNYLSIMEDSIEKSIVVATGE